MAETTKKSKTAVTETYDANSIRKLKGLEAVRMRPGMYVDSTDVFGLHVLSREILDNSVDEAIAGHCDEIVVDLRKDGSLSVKDNGRGIPVAKNADGEHAVHLVFEDLHAGGKFGDGGYKVSGGLHGVGASVTNALSEWLTVTVHVGGAEWQARWERGERKQGIKKVGKSNRTGTTVCFKFDDTIFNPGVNWNPNTIENFLRDRSYLVSGVKFVFRNEGMPERVYFHKTAGVKAYCQELAGEHTPIHKDALYFENDGVEVKDPAGKDTEVGVEVALQWTQDASQNVLAFGNIVRNAKGGTHVSGMSAALTRAMNNFAYEQGKLKKDNGKKGPESFKAEDIMAGLTAIVSVKVQNPQFGGQVKHTLNNAEVRTAVQTFLYGALTEWLGEKKNAATAGAILDRCLHARRIRLLAGKQSKSYDRSWLNQDASQSAKLADCQGQGVEPDERELFIVEGDSAGGTAKDARNNTFQAILPLRGKPINVFEKLEKKRGGSGKKESAEDKVFENKEVIAIINAMGARIEPVDDERVVVLSPENRRYGKLVVLADADSDGAHIAALMIGMMWKFFPDFVKEGRLFIARPPLYRVKMDARGDEIVFAYTEEEKEAAIKKSKRTGDDVVTRFKGLGEMGAPELEQTVMAPDTRQLYQVRIEDLTDAEGAFNLILSDKAAPRKQWLESGDAERYLIEDEG